MTYTTQNTLSKLMPSTYVRRKIGIYVHNITPRPLSRTRRTPINLPKSVLEHCVITDLKHTVGGSAKVLLLSISPYLRVYVYVDVLADSLYVQNMEKTARTRSQIYVRT